MRNIEAFPVMNKQVLTIILKSFRFIILFTIHYLYFPDRSHRPPTRRRRGTPRDHQEPRQERSQRGSSG